MFYPVLLLLGYFPRSFLGAIWGNWGLAMTTPSDPDEEAMDAADHVAMARLATGDTLALRPLFDRWKLPLMSFLYRSLGSHADAEDLALQTFEKVYRAAPRYRPETRFASWLFSIARNEVRHELRRRKRKPVEPVAPEDLEWVGTARHVDPAIKLAELEADLLTALQTLPERERSALVLSALEELSPSEVARSLGVKENHLFVIIHRARQKVRIAYAQINERATHSA